jgi:hypothetical protein
MSKKLSQRGQFVRILCRFDLAALASSLGVSLRRLQEQLRDLDTGGSWPTRGRLTVGRVATALQVDPQLLRLEAPDLRRLLLEGWLVEKHRAKLERAALEIRDYGEKVLREARAQKRAAEQTISHLSIQEEE